jgi:hypothetical protein
MRRPLLCVLGRHDDRVDYHRIGVELHYLAVCVKCGRTAPAPAPPEHPAVMRIPTRRERRTMQRLQRKGDPTARNIILGK